MTKLYLFDVEGTTTDIHFVHKVLFPYAYEQLEHFLLHHQSDPVIDKNIKEVQRTVLEEENLHIGLNQVISKLREWITVDRKHPALKEIQGLIWDIGYSKGEFQGHLYEDVKPFFEKILLKQCEIGIYSSGSVHAQKLIFGFSTFGDLTPMIKYHFDTKVGGKRERSSYEKIAKTVNLLPSEIHFFSDIAEELKAAQSAGLKVTQVLRDGAKESEFPVITNLNELNLDS